MASGDGMRSTTLRDARKLDLLPSVTGITNILERPGLSTWKTKEAVKSALSLQRQENESEDYFIKRAIDASMDQVEEAANLGTRIHDAIENVFDGEPVPPDLEEYVNPVIQWKKDRGVEVLHRELTLANNRHGFAGTMDVGCKWASGHMGVIDWKSRKTKPSEKKIKPYEYQGMQIAAYAATYWGEENLHLVMGANVYISTTEPGRLDVTPWMPEDLLAAWEAFKHACGLWRYSKKYDPRQKDAPQ